MSQNAAYKKKTHWVNLTNWKEILCELSTKTIFETFSSLSQPHKCFSISRHTFSPSMTIVLLFPTKNASAAYTSEPAWLWAGTMTATAPMRVSVEELICGDAESGGGIWGWAPWVLLGMATTGLLRSCGGAPFVLGGRLCLRDGVPPML